MKNCPIVAHVEPKPSAADVDSLNRLTSSLLRERPSLALEEDFRTLVPHCLDDAPALHVDDLTWIYRTQPAVGAQFFQERARLRAGNGDLVATSIPVADGYESYCRARLGLGAVAWLRPRPTTNPLKIAEACWQDERTRSLLLAKVRDGLRYLHPHMGTFAVWELAALLRNASQCPIKVIAPPPGLCKWVNNKVVFAELVLRLFGPEFVQRTLSACNFALLAVRVRELAREFPTIGIKIPHAAGGDGTLVLPAKLFVKLSLGGVRDKLKTVLTSLNWDGASELLVNSWESEVISSPSVQLWIPPIEQGEPLVEGIYTQSVEGPTGMFVGSVPATLPSDVTQEIATRSWLLGRLFQQLGYLGRCSFDLLLVGTSMSAARLKFIECNGRWGGTSGPMTLMNRLFGDWARQPYMTRLCRSAVLGRMSFEQLLELLGEKLYDCRTGSGNIVLLVPDRMATQHAIDVVGLGSGESEAQKHIAEFIAMVSE